MESYFQDPNELKDSLFKLRAEGCIGIKHFDYDLDLPENILNKKTSFLLKSMPYISDLALIKLLQTSCYPCASSATYGDVALTN